MQDHHRKRLKRYHSLGDLHEFTFSCYNRWPLLIDDQRIRIVCQAIDAACNGCRVRLIAFVFMPEHLHILADPIDVNPDLSRFLSAIKRPSSYRIKQLLTEANDPLVNRLTIQERPGKTTFRFWQEGAGYDRNLNRARAALAAIDYIHLNPVRRGLVSRADDWKWSSYRWYASDKRNIDADLPTIHGFRPGLLEGD